jgi:hypothetical protein
VSAHRFGTGHLLALAGLVTALVALWQPWYRLDAAAIGAQLRTASGGLETQAPGFGQALAQGLEQSLAQLAGSVAVDAWTALELTPALIAVAAVAAAVALLIGPAPAARQVALLAGAVISAAALYRGVLAPGPEALLETARGPWIALCGGLALLAGAALVGDETRAATPVATPAPYTPPMWSDVAGERSPG